MQVKDILRTDYLAVSPNDTLSSVFGKLNRGEHTEAIVLDDKGHYAGMLSKRALIRTRIDATQTKVHGFVGKPATLTPELDLARAAELLHDSDVHVLPVLDVGKRVLGICGARDVLDALKDSLTGRKAADVGTMKLITLNELDPVAKAIMLFREKHIDHIPIIDASSRLAGIVSFIDLLSRFLLGTPKVTGRGGKHGRTSKSGNDAGDRPGYDTLPVENVMTKIVITASPNARAEDIIKLLRDHRISDVVLVQGELPVGIVTTKDLLHQVAQHR